MSPTSQHTLTQTHTECVCVCFSVFQAWIILLSLRLRKQYWPQPRLPSPCVCVYLCVWASEIERELLIWYCSNISTFNLCVRVGHFVIVCMNVSEPRERKWPTLHCLRVCAVAGSNWDSSLNPSEDWWPKLHTNTWCYQLPVQHTHTHTQIKAFTRLCLCVFEISDLWPLSEKNIVCTEQ